jgi:hypothetical protein
MQHDVERIALDLIERFGAAAAHTAYEQADIAAALLDVPSANTWCDIADTIERLWPKPYDRQ